ncbi:hypothetical protein NLG97_g1739 [Lecanicillium saksenae]|uniref:Uncharacterized protein n=1 Tax=Lecanicillium saksenae TaxID=468837 RepID=A0ACC1R706_9HYPO|nr:hypothetical protein NLG97_g1739 [Lecanicillium saksenae]
MATTLIEAWNGIVAKYDPHTIIFAGHAAITITFWWIPCIVFFSLDYILPSFAARHKMQSLAKQPTMKEALHGATVAFRNDILSIPLYAALAYLSSSKDGVPAVRVATKLPSLTEFAFEFVLAFALREMLFYYGHRLFHWKPLFRRFHKIHHEFSTPIAIASKYAHPVEYLTADSLPVILPPLLLRVHVVSMWAYLAAVLFSSTVIHSGFDFFYKSARMHDRHHEGAMNIYYGAFGAFGMMDWIHGTVEKRQAKTAIHFNEDIFGPRDKGTVEKTQL